ncbi:hypothetical protein [Butyrivibrio sp. VCD2006]|uniref:hypothetical protein n=1 Tax=Butyrivibrio sp. VCD2006 TaxID=1280664 RepID=UPI0004006BD5|nr:hypothetical protein [Butyrivibrio sp. VCD2006]
MNKRYMLYGLTIESEVEFRQLLKADDNSESDALADVFIRHGNCADEVIENLTMAGALEKKYEIGLEYSCFMNKGGYYVIRDGKEIIFEAKSGYNDETVSAWLLGFSMAMLLLQRKTLAIHCSAVCGSADDITEGAILISGEPGAGKSTLTKKLLEDGYNIMADDVAAVRCVDDVMVYPAFPYQKLVRNEVEKRGLDKEKLIYINEDKDKFLVPVGDAFCAKPQRLKCMAFIVVADVQEVQLQKLSGLNQLMAVKQNLFLHRLSGEWENNKEVLQLCMSVAGKCPVYLIARPANVDSVEAIADIVKKLE